MPPGLAPRLLDGKSVACDGRAKYALGELMFFFYLWPAETRCGLSRVRVGYTAGEAIGPEIFRFLIEPSLAINLKQLLRTNRGRRWFITAAAGRRSGRSDTVGCDLAPAWS